MNDKREDGLWQELNLMSVLLIIFVLFVLVAIYFAFDAWSPTGASVSTFKELTLSAISEAIPTFIAILLALTLLSRRQRLEKEKEREEIAARVAQELQDKFSGLNAPAAEKFFITPPNITPLINQANTIDLCGVVLSTTIKLNFTPIVNAIRAGKTVRVLLADDESVRAAGKRSRVGADSYVTVQKIALSNLKDIFDEANQVSHTGTLQVRLLDHAPTMSIKAFDSNDSDKAHIFAEVYPYKLDDVLHFELTERDGKWLVYFRELFEELWKSGKEWTPTQVDLPQM